MILRRSYFIFFIVLFIATTSHALRVSRPPTLVFPIEEDQVSQINKFNEDMWLMQYGRFELDTSVDSKTDAKNGEFWAINTGVNVLIQLKADDTVYSFTPTVGRYRIGSVWHAYGGYMDEGYTLPCDADTWRLVTNADNTLWVGLETDGISFLNDQMVIANTGDYAGTVTLTISGLNGKDFHLRIYNVTQARVEGYSLGISTTGAGNEMSISIPVYIEATAGDVLAMQINSTDGADPILDDGLFYLTYLHD